MSKYCHRMVSTGALTRVVNTVRSSVNISSVEYKQIHCYGIHRTPKSQHCQHQQAVISLPWVHEMKLKGNESQGRMYNFLIVIIMFPLDLDWKHLTLTGGWSLSRKWPDSFQDFIPGLNNTLADLGPWQPIGGTNCNFYKIMPRNKTPDFAADYFGKFTVPLFWHSNSNLAVFSLLPPVSFPSSWSESECETVRAGPE